MRLQARYAWAAPAFNPNLISSSSSGLLASLKDKVKRIRYTPYPAHSVPLAPHVCLAQTGAGGAWKGMQGAVCWDRVGGGGGGGFRGRGQGERGGCWMRGIWHCNPVAHTWR